jgi:mono/diheme cytochrome c family protein
MKSTSKIALTVAIGLMSVSSAAWAAEDGAALYKKRCTQCHGAAGEGKPAMKAPALKGTAIAPDQIQQLLTQGASGKKAPHAKAISGLSAEQAKAIGEYVKTL